MAFLSSCAFKLRKTHNKSATDIIFFMVNEGELHLTYFVKLHKFKSSLTNVSMNSQSIKRSKLSLLTKYLILMILVTFLSACEKEETTRTLQGHIYLNCDNEPMAGIKLYAKAIFSKPFNFYSLELGEFTTDKNGYYSVTYTSDRKFHELRISDVRYSSIPFIDVEYEEHLNLTHYVNGFITHNVHLLVDDPLTSNDTLFLATPSFMSTPLLVVPGPFKDGQNHKIELGNKTATTPYRFGYRLSNGADVNSIRFVWGIGSIDFWQYYLAPLDYTQAQAIDVSRPVCGVGAEVIIDLRNKKTLE